MNIYQKYIYKYINIYHEININYNEYNNIW
jgi:hypothetical protein